MNKARIMANMTVKEVREGLKECRTVIVPVGGVEQHGCHLPLSVDIHNGVEIAARASDLCGCFVAPPVTYSFSGGMLPGTINVNPHVFSLVLIDICQSLVVQGFKNIVILLGHGRSENTRAARDAAENFQRLRPEITGITLSVIPFWELPRTYLEKFEQGDYHAALCETSLMLYWKPELVKMEQAGLDRAQVLRRAAGDQDGYLKKETAAAGKYLIPKLTQQPDIEVGVWGNYEGANAELGSKIATECARALAEIVQTLEGR